MSYIGIPTHADEELRIQAMNHGCVPVWCSGMIGWAYHCTCADGLHYCDQQCSVISAESAARSRE